MHLNVPSENKLRALLETKGSLVATNPGGIEWLVKALHPSDPVTTAMGVPDETSFPTVTIAYQATHKIIAPTEGLSPNWDLNLDCVPDHIQPLSWNTNVVDHGVGYGSLLNPQLAGASYAEKFGAWIKLKPVRHRLMYYGVTAILDAPALSNQGTVVACQHSVDPDVFNVVGAIAVPPAVKGGSKPPGAPPLIPVACSKHCRVFPSATMPSYDQSMGMPNAMVGPAKDGAYLPLRMTETSQRWQGVQDLSFVGANLSAGGEYYGDADYRIFTESVLPDTPSFSPPYVSVRSAYTNATGLPGGDLIYGPANGQFGYIGFAGLSKTASVAVTVRYGLEVQVLPSSILAPYQKSSPEYDPQALAAYFHISRQLKDAYPADYNDLSKLWSVIRSAAQAATPFLAGLGPYGQVAAAAIPAAIGIVDHVSARFSQSKGGAAARERAQAVVKAATSSAPRRATRSQPKQKKKKPTSTVGWNPLYKGGHLRMVTEHTK